MGLAMDLVSGHVANPSGTITAVTMATGDPNTVRNFNGAVDRAALLGLVRAGATAGAVQVRSPLFHDNVRGIQLESSEVVSLFGLPRFVGQPLYPNDTLVIGASGGSAETEIVGLVNWYSNLVGAAARLHMWGDISGLIKSIKPVEVSVTASATIGTWVDTALNATEDLLHANSDYAVLGYAADTQLALIAVKGQETGNLRVGGPGPVSTLDVSDYFVTLSQLHGIPMIPVFNADNKASIFVSVIDKAANTTSNVQLILAELSQNLPN